MSYSILNSGNVDFSTTQSPPGTQGPAATQSAPVTCTPEPPLPQNFSGYLVGAGRADCTGQVADINLVGKPNAPQETCKSFGYFISCFHSQLLFHYFLQSFVLNLFLFSTMNNRLWEGENVFNHNFVVKTTGQFFFFFNKWKSQIRQTQILWNGHQCVNVSNDWIGFNGWSWMSSKLSM